MSEPVEERSPCADSAPVQKMQVTVTLYVDARSTEEAVAEAAAQVRDGECIVHIWHRNGFDIGPFYRSGVWRDAIDASRSDGYPAT